MKPDRDLSCKENVANDWHTEIIDDDRGAVVV